MLIEAFTRLSSLNVEERHQACQDLVAELLAEHKTLKARLASEEGERSISSGSEAHAANAVSRFPLPTSHLEYSLKRLVRGLASARDASRQGFALALIEILGAIPEIDVDFLLQQREKELSAQGNLPKDTARERFFGDIFFIVALIHSDRLTTTASVDTNVAEDKTALLATRMLAQLIEHANRKSYLPIVCYEAVVELLKRTSFQVFKHHFVPVLQPIIYQPQIEAYTPEALFTALAVLRQFPDDTQLRSKWADFDTNDGFASLLRKMRNAFTESTHSHPMVHPLWDLLLSDLVAAQSKSGANPDSFEDRLRQFWAIVIDETLLSRRKSLELFYLAFMLFSKLLPQLKPRFVPLLFSHNFVNQLKVALLRKLHSPIYPAAKYAADAMLRTAAQNPEVRKSISTSIRAERKLLRIPMLKTFAETRLSFDEIRTHVDSMINLFKRAITNYNSEKNRKREEIRQIKHLTWILDQLEQQSSALFRLCISHKNAPHISEIRSSFESILRFFQSIAFYCSSSTPSGEGANSAKASETITIVLNQQPTEVTIFSEKAIPTEVRDACSTRFTNLLCALSTRNTTPAAPKKDQQEEKEEEQEQEESDTSTINDLSREERTAEWLERSISFATSIENVSSAANLQQAAKRRKQSAQPTAFHGSIEFYGPMKDASDESMATRKRILDLASKIEKAMKSDTNIETIAKRRFLSFLNIVRVAYLYMPIQPSLCAEWLEDMEAIFNNLFATQSRPRSSVSKTPTKQTKKTRVTTNGETSVGQSAEKPLIVLADLCIAILSASPNFFSRFVRSLFSSFASAFLELDSNGKSSENNVMSLLVNAIKNTNEDSAGFEDLSDSDEFQVADSSDAESDHKEDEDEDEDEDDKRKKKTHKMPVKPQKPPKENERSDSVTKDEENISDEEEEEEEEKEEKEEEEEEEEKEEEDDDKKEKDEEDEELLGDDAMVQMNHALSLIFHQKRLELLRKQESRRNLRQFKFEVLHLLTILLNSSSTTTPLLSMLLPLIECMQAQINLPIQQTLNRQMANIVHTICTRSITPDGSEFSGATEEAIRGDTAKLIREILSRKTNKLHPSFFEAATFLTNALLSRASRLPDTCDFLLNVYRDIFSQDRSNGMQRSFAKKNDASSPATKLLTSFAKTLFERNSTIGYKFVSSVLLGAVGNNQARLPTRIYALVVLGEVCTGPLSGPSFFADVNQVRDLLPQVFEKVSSLLKDMATLTSTKESENKKQTGKLHRAFGVNLYTVIKTVRKILSSCRSHQIQIPDMNAIHAALDEIVTIPNLENKTSRLCKEFKGETPISK